MKLLIVDDHPAVRSRLYLRLRTVGDVEIVGLAEDGDEAVELSAATHPDVVLMDYSMPGINGAEATRRIMAIEPGARVVGLTMYGPELSDRMCEAGAVACLTKSGDLDELVAAIRIAGNWPVSKLR